MIRRLFKALRPEPPIAVPGMACDGEDLPPVAIYLVWHPAYARGGDFARTIFSAFCANPEIPASRGLGLAVRFRTSNAPDEVPTSIPFAAAKHTAIFVLADDLLVAAPTWRSFCEELAQSARPTDRVIPVAVTATANLPPKLRDLQAIRLNGVPVPLQETLLLNDAMHDICRLLDPDAAKVKVFLSHAKHDGLGITTSVRRHLHEEARLDEFFDAADIPDGTRFGDAITQAAGSLPVLLAVQTDTYASREWCRLEVLEAKQRRVPIVVLSAVQKGESRSFPYIGNVPVVRWHNESSLPVVVGSLLTEVLRARYFPQRVDAICRYHGLGREQHVFPYPPELVTLLAHRAEVTAAGETVGRYVYPDPPLGTEELLLLHGLDPNIDPVTPTILRSL